MFITGKVALITGGASGIGLGIARNFLKNGAKGVALLDISETFGHAALRDLTAEFGPQRAIFLHVDVSQAPELEDGFQKTVERFQQLDVVVNNAGIIDELNWEKSVEVNLNAVIRGSYLAMMTYLPRHKSGEEGIIVNVSSTAGVEAVHALPVYCTTKFGVVSFGISLGNADFYNKFKVKVLTVCPGATETPMLAPKLLDDNAFFQQFLEEEVASFGVRETPDTIGRKVVKLLDDGASGSIWVMESQAPIYEVSIPLRKDLMIKSES